MRRPTTNQFFDPKQPISQEVDQLLTSVSAGYINDWKTAASILADAVNDLDHAVRLLLDNNDKLVEQLQKLESANKRKPTPRKRKTHA